MMTTPNSQLLELGAFFREVVEGIADSQAGRRPPPKAEMPTLDGAVLLDSMRAIVTEELQGLARTQPLLGSDDAALREAQAVAADSARRIEELELAHQQRELALRQQLHERYEEQLQAERSRQALVDERVITLENRLDVNETTRQSLESELRERSDLLAVLRSELNHMHEQAQHLERNHALLVGQIDEQTERDRQRQAEFDACQAQRDEALRAFALQEDTVAVLNAELEQARNDRQSQQTSANSLRLEFEAKFEERESEALHMLLAAEQRAREDRQTYIEQIHQLTEALDAEQLQNAQLKDAILVLEAQAENASDVQAFAAEFQAKDQQQQSELSELREALKAGQELAEQLQSELASVQTAAVADAERLAEQLRVREEELQVKTAELDGALLGEHARTAELQAEIATLREALDSESAARAADRALLEAQLSTEQTLTVQLQANIARLEQEAQHRQQADDRRSELTQALDAERAQTARLKTEILQFEARVAAAAEANTRMLAAVQELSSKQLLELGSALKSEQTLTAQLLADIQALEARSNEQDLALAQAQAAADADRHARLEAQAAAQAREQALIEARSQLQALNDQQEASRKRASVGFLAGLGETPPVDASPSAAQAAIAAAPVAPAPVAAAVQAAVAPMSAVELEREQKRLAILSQSTDVATAKLYFQMLPWQGLKTSRISVAANERGDPSGTLAGFAVAAATQQAIDSSLSTQPTKARP